MKSVGKEIEKSLFKVKNPEKAAHLQKFFKTGRGEYGEGDMFLGINVPVTRAIIKNFKDKSSISDVKDLINSQWHEIRLAGFLLLVEIYKKYVREKKVEDAKACVDFYLDNLISGNNWDLVDLVAPYLLGDWLVSHYDDRKILYELSDNKRNLWEQRVAIVSTLPLIKNREFDETFHIAIKYFNHPHDLIHKATGWMLREVGKKGGYERLKNFLNQYGPIMPRTMLRYSIEKFEPEIRHHYLNLK